MNFSNVPVNIKFENYTMAKKVSCGSTYTAYIDFNGNIIYFGKIFNSPLRNSNFCGLNFSKNFIGADNTAEFNIDEDLITCPENIKSNAKLINLNGLVSNIFSGASLISIIDVNGFLYLYNDKENLFKVRVDNKINSIKFVGLNFYAMAQNRKVLYEFVNKTGFDSIKNYTETSYNIGRDYSNISLIEQPYYSDLLFFLVQCTKANKEEAERGKKKILNIKKNNNNIDYSNYNNMRNIASNSSIFNNERNIYLNLNKINSSNSVSGSLFSAKDNGLISDEDASNDLTTKFVSNDKNRESLKFKQNIERSSIGYSSYVETNIKNNEDLISPSVYPPNTSLRKIKIENPELTLKLYGRTLSNNSDQVRNSSESNNRIDRIKNLFGYIFNKQINHINSQISFTEKLSPSKSLKKKIELERVRKNTLSPELNLTKNNESTYFNDILNKSHHRRQTSYNSNCNYEEENQNNMWSSRKSLLDRRETKNKTFATSSINNISIQRIKSNAADFQNFNNNVSQENILNKSSQDLESCHLDHNEEYDLHTKSNEKFNEIENEYSSSKLIKSKSTRKKDINKNRSSIYISHEGPAQNQNQDQEDAHLLVNHEDMKTNINKSKFVTARKGIEIDSFKLIQKINYNEAKEVSKKTLDEQESNLNNLNVSSMSNISKNESIKNKINLSITNTNTNSDDIILIHPNFISNNIKNNNLTKANLRYQETYNAEENYNRNTPTRNKLNEVKNFALNNDNTINENEKNIISNIDCTNPLLSARETDEKYLQSNPMNFEKETIFIDFTEEISSSTNLNEKSKNILTKEDNSYSSNLNYYNRFNEVSNIHKRKLSNPDCQSQSQLNKSSNINKITIVNGRGSSADNYKNTYSTHDENKTTNNELIFSKREVKKNMASNFNKKFKNSSTNSDTVNKLAPPCSCNNLDKNDKPLKLIETVEIKNGNLSITNIVEEAKEKEKVKMTDINLSFNQSLPNCSITSINIVNKSPELKSNKEIIYIKKIKEKTIISLNKNGCVLNEDLYNRNTLGSCSQVINKNLLIIEKLNKNEICTDENILMKLDKKDCTNDEDMVILTEKIENLENNCIDVSNTDTSKIIIQNEISSKNEKEPTKDEIIHSNLNNYNKNYLIESLNGEKKDSFDENLDKDKFNRRVLNDLGKDSLNMEHEEIQSKCGFIIDNVLNLSSKNLISDLNLEISEIHNTKSKIINEQDKNLPIMFEQFENIKKDDEFNTESSITIVNSNTINSPSKTEKKEKSKSKKSWNHFKQPAYKSQNTRKDAKNDNIVSNNTSNPVNKLNANPPGFIIKEIYVNNTSNHMTLIQSNPNQSIQSNSLPSSILNGFNQDMNIVHSNQLKFSSEISSLENKLNENTLAKINKDFTKDLQTTNTKLKGNESKGPIKHKRNLSLEIKQLNNTLNLPKEIIPDNEEVNKTGTSKIVNKNLNSNNKNFSPPCNKSSSRAITPITSEEPIRISYDYSSSIIKTDKLIEIKENGDLLNHSESQVSVFKIEDLQIDEQIYRNLKKIPLKDGELKLLESQIIEKDDDTIFYLEDDDNELTDIAEVDELNESEPNSYRMMKRDMNNNFSGQKINVINKRGLAQHVIQLSKRNENFNINSQDNSSSSAIQTKSSNIKMNKSKKNISSSLIKNTTPSTPIEMKNSIDMTDNNKIDTISQNLNFKMRIFDNSIITTNTILNSNKTEITNFANKENEVCKNTPISEINSAILNNSANKQCLSIDNIIEEEKTLITSLKRSSSKIINVVVSYDTDSKVVESSFFKESTSPRNENNIPECYLNTVQPLVTCLKREEIFSDESQNLKRSKTLNLENELKNMEEISEELTLLTLQNDKEKKCIQLVNIDMLDKTNKIELTEYEYNPIPTEFTEDINITNNELNYLSFNNSVDKSKIILEEENLIDNHQERRNSNTIEINNYIKIVEETKGKINELAENKIKIPISITPSNKTIKKIGENGKPKTPVQNKLIVNKWNEVEMTGSNNDAFSVTSSIIFSSKKNSFNNKFVINKEIKNKSISPRKNNYKNQRFSQSTKIPNKISTKRDQSSNRNKTNSSVNNSNSNSANFSITNSTVSNSNSKGGVPTPVVAQQSQHSHHSNCSLKTPSVVKQNKIAKNKVLTNRNDLQINIPMDKLKTPNYIKAKENLDNANYSSNVIKTAPNERPFTKSNTQKNFNKTDKLASSSSGFNIIKNIKNDKKNIVNTTIINLTTSTANYIRSAAETDIRRSFKKTITNFKNNKLTKNKISNSVKKNITKNSLLATNNLYYQELTSESVSQRCLTENSEGENTNKKNFNEKYKTEFVPCKKKAMKSLSIRGSKFENNSTSGNSKVAKGIIFGNKSNSNKKAKTNFSIFTYRNKQPSTIETENLKTGRSSANFKNRKPIDIHSSKYPSNKYNTKNSTVSINPSGDKDEKTLRDDLEQSIKKLLDAFNNYVNFKVPDARHTIVDILMSKLGGRDIKELLHDHEKEPQMIRMESKESSFSFDDDTSVFNEEGLPLEAENEKFDPDEMRKFIYKNLENFKLKRVQEKLETYLKEILKIGNISPNVGLCLTPVRTVEDETTIKERPSEFEPIELNDTSQITLSQSILSHRNINNHIVNTIESNSGNISISKKINESNNLLANFSFKIIGDNDDRDLDRVSNNFKNIGKNIILEVSQGNDKNTNPETPRYKENQDSNLNIQQ